MTSGGGGAHRGSVPSSPTADAIRARRAAVPSDLRVWEVQRGDDFRSITVQVLTEAWRRAPSAPEIEAFRRAMIELNRDRLTDPARPDDLVHGQKLLVPLTPRPLGPT